MATEDEARQALIDAIAKMAPKVARPSSLLQLAEASAWLSAPAQPHGSNSTTTPS